MPNDPQNPEPGELIIDATPIAKHLRDLQEGDTRGMLTEQPEFSEVVAEMRANQASIGDKAGITSGDFADFQTSNEVVAKIDSYLPAARKLVEILEESRALHDDRRQRIAYATADAVERRAKTRDDGGTLLAKYQKTRAYRSAIGLKASRTRRRNAAQNAETPVEPEGPTTSPDPAA